MKELDVRKLLGSNHKIEDLIVFSNIITDPSNVTPEILKMRTEH